MSDDTRIRVSNFRYAPRAWGPTEKDREWFGSLPGDRVLFVRYRGGWLTATTGRSIDEATDSADRGQHVARIKIAGEYDAAPGPNEVARRLRSVFAFDEYPTPAPKPKAPKVSFRLHPAREHEPGNRVTWWAVNKKTRVATPIWCRKKRPPLRTWRGKELWFSKVPRAVTPRWPQGIDVLAVQLEVVYPLTKQFYEQEDSLFSRFNKVGSAEQSSRDMRIPIAMAPSSQFRVVFPGKPPAAGSAEADLAELRRRRMR